MTPGKIALLATFLLVLLAFPGALGVERACPAVTVYFSPSGGCTEAVISALDKATNTVLVQAYSFTSAPIAKALVEAHRRGVQTTVILDKSQRTEKYSSATFLANAGIRTLIER